ncbi:MAG: hypothetical protein ABIY55_35420 [Kofleriaceae bacterium]
MLDDRADVELRAPLPRAPHARVGLMLTCVEEQLGELAPRRLDLVVLVTADLEKLPGSGMGHEDLPCFTERWT